MRKSLGSVKSLICYASFDKGVILVRIENIADKVIEADVLVIGGGIAGSFASIKAAEEKVRVVTWEKAVVQRSGGASGGPQQWHGLPERTSTQEETMETLTKGRGFAGGGGAGLQADKLEGLRDKNFNLVLARDAWDRIHDLESWDVNMRWDDGEYNLLPDPATGKRTELRYHGTGLKKKLSEQIVKSGVDLFERTMAIDLLTENGAVVGATGFNVRTGEFIVCKARAVVMATGWPTRTHYYIHGPMTGKYKMIYGVPDSGDGIAIAIRAGAEVVNMELPRREGALMYEHDGFIGKIGSIHQVYPPVPVINAKGEKVADACVMFPRQWEEELAGRTPCYLDTTALSEESIRFIEAARYDEFPLASRMWKVRGLDLRTHKWEVSDYSPYGFSTIAGVLIDVDTKTRLKGLFAAGGNTGAGGQIAAMSGAAVVGAIAGTNAAKYAAKAKQPKVDETQVQAHKKIVFAPMERRDGVRPLELEIKLRDIMWRYCGALRSDGKLNQGLWRLHSVKDKFFPEMIAKNPHELMSCQEVRNLFLLGEVQLVSARERKESGGGFFRVDYPGKKDDPWQKAIVACLEDAEIKITRRRMPDLRPEFTKKET